MRLIKVCPIEDTYRFTSQCTITTCKYHTVSTENRCLSLDTYFVGNDKSITDNELILYKCPKMSERDVSTLRKRSIQSAHSIIALHHFIEHIRKHEKPDTGFNMAMARSIPSHVRFLCKKVLTSKVYNIPYLRAEPWMIRFLFDTHYVKELNYTERFSITSLFGLSNREVKLLSTTLTKRKSK
jgi:hypothetical protein